MLLAKDYFDTIVDTELKSVPMKTMLVLHHYENVKKEHQIYFSVCIKKRKRIGLGVYVKKEDWDLKRQLVKVSDAMHRDKNLLLKNALKKAYEIDLFYRLSNKTLNIENFLYEFKNELPRANFVRFAFKILEDRKKSISKTTFEKENAVLSKLEKFKDKILFSEIDEKFFFDYRNYLAKLGNKSTTRNGNIKIIKKYLRFALRFGVKLQINLEDIKSGSTAGQKIFLNGSEVEKLYKYYFSEYVTSKHKIALGYFLTSCFTGLRFSDIRQQNRNQLLKGYTHFKHVKTGKTQNIELNEKALAIIKNCHNLFIDFYSNSYTRILVKEVCKFLGIEKNIDYHTSRHTFGTNCILVGIPVTKVQMLMNHSDIKETMVYVHLAEYEKNCKADLLDNLF